MLYTLSHEIVHDIRATNPASFENLFEFVVNEYIRQGKSADDILSHYELKYKDKDLAREEFVADSMESVLVRAFEGDTKPLSILKSKCHDVWLKIREMLTRIARTIVNEYKGLMPDSEAGRFVAQLSDDTFNVLKDMYFDAMSKAAESRQHFRGLDELVAFLDEHNISREGTDLEHYKIKNTANHDGVKFSFAGREAVNSDISLLRKAQSMIENGVDSETVRKETGWFRGYDGKWRFEIDDSKMTITQSDRKYLQETSSTLLGYLINHNELFKSYPQLRDVMVYSKDANGDGDAYYDPKYKSITISPRSLRTLSDNGLKSILIHEIQHAIQDIEGFTPGTDTSDFVKYLNTAGEIEAYDTSDRVDFTADQRKNTRPDIDRTSVVFSENGTRSLYLAGTTKEGYEVYRTSDDIKSKPYSDKIKIFEENFYKEGSPHYLGKLVNFQHNDKVYSAEINRHTQNENIEKLNPKHLNQWDKAKINIGAEGDFLTLLENARYDRGKENTSPKKNDVHKVTKYFEYYVKTVWIDDKMYDVIVNISVNKKSNRFVYEVKLNKKKNSRHGPQIFQSYENNFKNRRPKVNKATRLSEFSNGNISQNSTDVKDNKLYQARPDFADILFDDFEGEVTDDDSRLITEYINGKTDVVNHLINNTRNIPLSEHKMRGLVSRLLKSYELSEDSKNDVYIALTSLLESNDKTDVKDNLSLLQGIGRLKKSSQMTALFMCSA